MATHRFAITNRWTGNLGSGTSGYTAYSRNHEVSGAGKVAVIPGCSDPAFRGDGTRYNPEELLVASLSTCHMLWLLHLCADAGIAITEYVDDASGEMAIHGDGGGEFVGVTLRPRMTITDAGRVGEAMELHHRAHELCFIARSVKFAVWCEAVVQGPSGPSAP
jgi:organic hydroperoxide reductase OsmC/OhrA